MVGMVQRIAPGGLINDSARGLWWRRPHPDIRAGKGNCDADPAPDGNTGTRCADPNARTPDRDTYAGSDADADAFV